MESDCVLRRGLRSLIAAASRTQSIRTLSGICVGSETGFHLGDMSFRGPPKVVYQSLSSYVQQCVGEGVGQYTRHNPYHLWHLFTIGTSKEGAYSRQGSRAVRLSGKSHRFSALLIKWRVHFKNACA